MYWELDTFATASAISSFSCNSMCFFIWYLRGILLNMSLKLRVTLSSYVFFLIDNGFPRKFDSIGLNFSFACLNPFVLYVPVTITRFIWSAGFFIILNTNSL